MAEFPIEMLRTLKGPPLAVLIALMIAEEPVQCDWLARVTGYTDKPVRQALELLQEYGMAARLNRHAWQAAHQIRQLSFDTSRKPNRRISGSLTTATATKVDDEEKQPEQQNKHTSSRKNSALKQCLYDAGIREPTLSQLEALSWVTLEYAQAIVKQARREKISAGLLVHRLRCNDLVQHPAGCGCAWCREQSSKSYRESLRAAGYEDDEY